MADTDTSHTYKDDHGGRLIIDGQLDMISISYPGAGSIGVNHPAGEDTVALARAVLAADGNTGHEVVDVDRTNNLMRMSQEFGARSMRERAIDANENSGTRVSRADITAKIRALPLLPEVAHSGGSQTASETPNEPPAGADFRVHLVAEALGEDRENAADMLADDPQGTWERVYAIWHLEQGRLDEYRRGKDPVVDRVSQLERDQARTERHIRFLDDTDGKLNARLADAETAISVLTRTVDALELTARETHQSGGAPRAEVAGGGYAEEGEA